MKPFVFLFLLAFPAGLCLGQPLKLPLPPQQSAAWRAPASLPTNLISAAETLLKQGFPDPRGCEYREVEVEVSGVWGGNTFNRWDRFIGETASEPNGQNQRVRTHGWVLPEKRGQAERFAICWNGLIYPAWNVGAAVDLHAEATNLTAASARRFNSAIGETHSVFATNSPSTRVLLLLRCGETEAALKNLVPDERLAWERGMFRQGQPPGTANTNGYDPYLQFAGDWAWALFDRAVCAHMRGDAPLALATARKLAEVQPMIEAEAAKRKFPRARNYNSPGPGNEKPYLDFLEPLPQLLADLERRGREGKRTAATQNGLTNIVNRTERIAALIRDLEFVQVRQWGQPGGVQLARDPVVAALIQEGDAAVEPLLDCVETDKRLTRSVSFGRDFFRSRNVIPVTSAAWAALPAILQANFGSAAEVRVYWKKYGGLKLEERWYAILSDDAAGMGRWLEAAAIIAQPGSPATTNTPATFRGEALRAKFKPSVSELLSRRAVEVPPASPSGYDLGAACEIGLRLAAWDAPTASPVAKALVERCRAVLEYSDEKDAAGRQRVGSLLAKLTLLNER